MKRRRESEAKEKEGRKRRKEENEEKKRRRNRETIGRNVSHPLAKILNPRRFRVKEA